MGKIYIYERNGERHVRKPKENMENAKKKQIRSHRHRVD